MPPQKNVSHEEWLRACVDYGFPAKNILFVGLRNSDIVEIKYMSENSIKQIKINDLMNDLEDVTDSIMEFSSGKELYVSFDIDFIDPAFAPSTGYIEPGGATSREALYIVSRIGLMKNLRVFDLVEINEKIDKQVNNRTVKLGAKILSELV